MATLILAAAGTAVAGPIGGAVGAIIGQTADQAIFGPRARHGPRLGDLSVQTSTYGTQIPRIFGRMRVAGTVVWATDLVERRSSSGGGKGRPRTISYSYFANFAVALSARRLRAVHRIWADGKLLRGAGGDFKSRTGFRFHSGDEDQAPDPLIASAEGADSAPAFRGISYVVFEDLELGDFGNRIPSLTFEVEADEGEIGIGHIVEELSDGAVVGGSTPSVIGYAATGDSVRSASAVLADAAGLTLREAGDRLRLEAPAGPPSLIEAAAAVGSVEIRRGSAAAAPRELSLSYYEPERDYQTGVQRAVRPGGDARTEMLALAAALSSSAAKAFAEDRLAALWEGRSTAKLRLQWRQQALRPGKLVRIERQPGVWKVARWLLGAAALEIELVRVGGAPLAGVIAGPGRAVGSADLVHGPTTLRLFEAPLPAAGEGLRLFAAAAGISPGWRRAALLLRSGGSSAFEEVGPMAQPAIIGHALTALHTGPAALIDDRGEVDVQLLNGAMWLESRTDAALADGQNLALLGAELIQFGSAASIGNGRFRLRRLLRGRFGTDWASDAHAPGEAFVLIDAATLLPLPLPLSSVGAAVEAAAIGIGDSPEGASQQLVVAGETLRPPSPVHLSATLTAAGDVELSWVRRSRSGWEWQSGGDAPLAEEAEAYSVTLSSGSTVRTVRTSEPRFLYTAAEQAADGMGRPLGVSVVQIGTYASSRAALLSIG